MNDSYFGFLMDIVKGYDGTHERGVMACGALFDIPFRWSHKIPLDADRAENGVALRVYYYKKMHKYTGIEGSECNMLEMLVALAMAMDSVVSWSEDPHPERWFWEMLENVGIDDVDDYGYVVEVVGHVLDRRYKANGSGGFFPLKFSPIDQRTNPIWNQASAYICERV